MRKWIPCFGIVMLWIGGSAAQAADPFCVELERELSGKVFVAKVALYDTEIGHDMIYHLERDAEEIREGEQLRVVEVDCDKRTLEMKLKPMRRGDKVEIKFYLSRDERASQDGRKLLEKMMGYVFENDKKSD